MLNTTKIKTGLSGYLQIPLNYKVKRLTFNYWQIINTFYTWEFIAVRYPMDYLQGLPC
jgi:hypothetical protein